MPLTLMTSYSGSFGGAERALIDFAQALDGERCLACPEGPLAVAARERGIRVFPLAARSLELRSTLADRALAAWRLAMHAREARALVGDLDPSLVIACGMRSALGLSLTPPYVFLHNDLLPGPLIGRFVRAAARRSVLVIVPSCAVADDLGMPATVIPPGVDLSRFAAGSEAGLAGAEPGVVLTVGAIVPWKRPDLALEALAIARRAQPDLRLRLLGAPLGVDGEALLERLRARASMPDLSGAVEIAGAVADPAEALRGASCLLHCASREPFGIALVEALASGCPVVAPASAGPLEIVDRSCGVLYPPDDPGAAADALLRATGEPELRAGARERARRFDVRRARERFAAAVRPIGARAGGGPAAPRTGAIAIVTVTHNSEAELESMLPSVAGHLPGVHVVVVDAASSDGTAAVARRQWDRLSVQLIALERNVGFGAACNRGVSAVTAPVTALLNPDIELLDDSLLNAAAEAMRGQQRLIAPLVLSPDGTRQDTVHPVPASFADLARAMVPPAAVPGAALAPWRSGRPRRVGWAVGCAVVARTATLRRLGPFDERIFLYGEDLDLGLRARAAGVETWFWPYARVLHHRAHSTERAFGGEPFELLARARHETVDRRLGSRRAALDSAAQTVMFASRFALKRMLQRPAERERRQLEATRQVRRGG
jgi:GT2 family glycosyltransferase/glycosyltransferase involved in cell wall biosynthesis